MTPLRPLTRQRRLVMMAIGKRKQAKGAAGAVRRSAPDPIDTSCPHCRREIPRKLWKSNGAKLMHLSRKTKGGPGPSLRPCPHCKGEYGVVAMRQHIPVCEKRPPLSQLTPAQRAAERAARGQQ